MTTETPALTAEIEFRQKLGARRLSVAELTAEFASLGYTLDRSLGGRDNHTPA